MYLQMPYRITVLDNHQVQCKPQDNTRFRHISFDHFWHASLLKCEYLKWPTRSCEIWWHSRFSNSMMVLLSKIVVALYRQSTSANRTVQHSNTLVVIKMWKRPQSHFIGMIIIISTGVRICSGVIYIFAQEWSHGQPVQAVTKMLISYIILSGLCFDSVFLLAW